MARAAHRDLRTADVVDVWKTLAKHTFKESMHMLMEYRGGHPFTEEDMGTIQWLMRALRFAKFRDSRKVCDTLDAFGRMSDIGLSVDPVAVRNLSDGVRRMAGDMSRTQVRETLNAFAKLAGNGAGHGSASSTTAATLDPAAVRAVSDELTKKHAGDLGNRHVCEVLVAYATLIDGGVDVDLKAVQAASDAATRVSGDLDIKRSNKALGAFATMAAKGVPVDRKVRRRRGGVYACERLR